MPFDSPESDDAIESPAGHSDSGMPEITVGDQTQPLSQPLATPDMDGAVLDAVSTPTHLHPSSLLFDFISHGRTYLVPVLFGLFGAANGNVTLLVISGIAFVPAVAISVFRYFTLRYRIEQKHLIVTQGLLYRQMRKVPVSRIQNIDLIQNLLHRMFGVAEVRIETASGTEPEATLRVLSMKQLEVLRQGIFADQQQAIESSDQRQPIEATETSSAAAVTPSASMATADEGIPVLRISVGELLKAGLASNRGLVMFGIVVGAYFQFAEDSYSDNLSRLEALVPHDLSTAWIVFYSVVGVIVGMLLLRLLGIGWYVLRFFDYRLDRRGDDLRISCGLLTRVSATVPRRRIQFISVHRPILMRWMGLASIRIETAGGSGEQQNATESVSKRWFVPAIAEARVAEVIEILRPGLSWEEEALEFHPLADRAFSRMARLAVFRSLLIAAVGLAVTRPWGFVAGVIALPLLLIWARRQSRSMRYARTDLGVIYRSGVLNRKISMTFFDKIQTIRVDESPFDRRWKMARLSVDTAAAGPAGHQISIPFLDEDFAKSELEFLRQQTGDYQPVFA